jgi:hypothetical protein
MTNDEQIIRLLTEIRDDLHEESVWRRKVIDESVRLQRMGILWQRIAVAAWGFVVVVGVLFLIYSMGLFGR